MNFWQRWLLKLANAEVKAISHRPDLADRQHIYTTHSHAEPHTANFDGYAQAYGSYVWVQKAIGKISDNFSALPVRVVDANDQPLDSHPVTELLAYVNDEETPVDLWSAYVVFKMLGGEAPVELVPDVGSRKRPVEMWIRRPDWILVRPDLTRLNYPRAAEYVYEPPDSDPIVIAPDWLVHDKFFNPLQPYRGLAPIAAVREGIIIDLFSQLWSKTFMKNGARPDFALVAPQGITKTEKDRYLSDFMRQHQGVENAHLPVVLEDGVTDIKTFSFAPKDLEWLEQRRFSRDEVGAIFGVPDEIMGYGKDTYENFQTALEVFWTLTLHPMALRRDMAFTNHFQKAGWLRPTERIATDFSEVGVLQEDIAPKLEMAIQLWDRGVPWQVLDERFGLGIGTFPGAEVGYVQGTMTPVELVALSVEQARNPQPEPVPNNAPPDNAPPDEAADDEPQPDADEQDDGDAEREAEERRFRVWARKRKHPDPAKFRSDILGDADKAAILAELQEDGDAGGAVPFALSGSITPETLKALRLQLDPDGGEDDDAEQRVRDEIERRFERNLARELRGQLDELIPADATDEQVRAAVSRVDETSGPVRDALRRHLQDSADLGASVAFDTLQNVGLGFDWTLAHVQASQWVQGYTFELVRGINDTSRQRLQIAVDEWFRNGDTLPQLRRELGPLFGRKRAKLIAQTETTRAAAEGSIIGFETSGVVQEKEWVTVRDERVCPQCGPLHGKRAPLRGAFDGNVTQPPRHPGCRCFVRPIVREPGE